MSTYKYFPEIKDPWLLVGAIWDRGSISQRLMRAVLVVPLQPRWKDASCVFERPTHALRDTRFFEAEEEPFVDPMLFLRIRRDKLLGQPMIRRACRNRRPWKIRPLSLRKTGAPRGRSVPNRAELVRCFHKTIYSTWALEVPAQRRALTTPGS